MNSNNINNNPRNDTDAATDTARTRTTWRSDTSCSPASRRSEFCTTKFTIDNDNDNDDGGKDLVSVPLMDELKLLNATISTTIIEGSSNEDQQRNRGVGANVLAGLTVAGLAASLLTTVFELFHVDIFLTAYRLPVSTYSYGSILYATINTANDVGGAWIVDQVATTRKRSDLVGITGCVFALCFLAPFFRPWTVASNWLWDGTHFVLSLSLYDTMFSFAMILYGSIICDDHEMSHAKRVRFLVICKVVNLVSSFGVARLGLYLFDANDLRTFRIFLLALALVVCLLSVASQRFISGDQHCNFTILRSFVPRRTAKNTDKAAKPFRASRRKLELMSVARDFWNHPNFRYWVGAEMLLESQNTFNAFFRKTFFDRLLIGANNSSVDKDTCDWLLSALRPITIIVSLGAYIPIQKYGYPKVYRALFLFNFLLSLTLLLVADSESTNWILMFLVIYPVITAAIQSAGFALAMADMTMEMKHMVVSEGRYNEPSLAGMFMGANALFCKPMESFLPVLAAQATSSNAHDNLFYVLILPPLVFSILQLLSWWNYDLDPNRAESKRKELKALLSRNKSGDAL